MSRLEKILDFNEELLQQKPAVLGVTESSPEQSKQKRKRGHASILQGKEEFIIRLASLDLSRKQISWALGVSESALYRFIKKSGLQEIIRRNRENRIKEDIRKLLSVTELAELWGVSRQAALQTINRYGMHEEWKRGRELKKEREKLRIKTIEGIVGIIAQKVAVRAYQDASWEERKAYEYMSLRRRRNTDINSLVKLLRAYKKARDNSERKSILDLAEETGFHFVKVSEILRELGLNTLCRNCKKFKRDLRKEIIEQYSKVRRYFNLSEADIAYFMGYKGLPTEYRPLLSEQKVKKRRGLRSEALPFREILTRRDRLKLTYRLASEVFEALDAGFTKQETAHLLDINESAVDFIIKNKYYISDRLKKALSILCPERKGKIGKPYLTPEERKNRFGKK